MFPQTQVSLAVPLKCSETPCSVRTRTQTAFSPHGSLRLQIPDTPHSLDSPIHERSSPSKPQLDLKSVRVHNVPVRFRFNGETGSSPMTFHLPFFHYQPQNLRFFKVTSAATFNYVPNARAEFGDITSSDLKVGTPALSIMLGGMNNLQVNRRLREERFDIFQKSDSKKIKKLTPRTKLFLNRQYRAEDGSIRTHDVGGNSANDTPQDAYTWASVTPQSLVATPMTPGSAKAKNCPPNVRISEFTFPNQPFEKKLETLPAVPEKILAEGFKFHLLRTQPESPFAGQLRIGSPDAAQLGPPEKC